MKFSAKQNFQLIWNGIGHKPLLSIDFRCGAVNVVLGMHLSQTRLPYVEAAPGSQLLHKSNEPINNTGCFVTDDRTTAEAPFTKPLRRSMASNQQAELDDKTPLSKHATKVQLDICSFRDLMWEWKSTPTSLCLFDSPATSHVCLR